MVDVSPQSVFQTTWLRDTVVSTWIMMAVAVVAVLIIRRRWPLMLEWLVEFLDGTIAGSIGRPTDIYLPFLGTLILFLAMANIFGIVP